MRPSLHRRRFLQLAGGGAAAWGLARLLPSCSQVARAPASELEQLWTRARDDGRPLLVLLAEPGNPEWRGLQWGAYLELASDPAMADLAACELAFAVPEQVRALHPRVELGTSELPQALLLRPGLRSLAPVPEPSPVPPWSVFVDAEKNPVMLREWIAQLEASIRQALTASGVPTSPDPRAAASLRERLRASAPAGGRWARSFGPCCEIQLEDGTRIDSVKDCGMAFLPEKSRRFLWLYSERPS